MTSDAAARLPRDTSRRVAGSDLRVQTGSHQRGLTDAIPAPRVRPSSPPAGPRAPTGPSRWLRAERRLHDRRPAGRHRSPAQQPKPAPLTHASASVVETVPRRWPTPRPSPVSAGCSPAAARHAIEERVSARTDRTVPRALAVEVDVLEPVDRLRRPRARVDDPSSCSSARSSRGCATPTGNPDPATSDRVIRVRRPSISR